MRGKKTHPLERHDTPDWVADVVIRHAAEHVSASDLLIEPSAGGGALCRRIVQDFPGLWLVGCDIDPDLPQPADGMTWLPGRSWEDLATDTDFWRGATRMHVIGNPPWSRFHEHLLLALNLGVVSVTFVGPLAYLGRTRIIAPDRVTFLSGRPWKTARECAVYTWAPLACDRVTRVGWVGRPGSGDDTAAPRGA